MNWKEELKKIKVKIEKVSQRDTLDYLLITPIYTEDYLAHKASEDKRYKIQHQYSLGEIAISIKETFAKPIDISSNQKSSETFGNCEENPILEATIQELASCSIQKDECLITESLAEVYALQGKVKQAIEMYQKLCLQFPEKNIFFANKIKQLENNI